MLIAESAAVLSWVGPADQHPPFVINPDRLRSAQRRVSDLDSVSSPRQFGNHRLTIGAFDLEYPARMREATRSFRGLLRIHPAIEHTMQKMSVAGGLVMAPDDTKRHYCTPILAQHAGNDRVQRPLPRRDRVRMPGDELETGASVLQQHPTFRCDDAAAKGSEKRV